MRNDITLLYRSDWMAQYQSETPPFPETEPRVRITGMRFAKFEPYYPAPTTNEQTARENYQMAIWQELQTALDALGVHHNWLTTQIHNCTEKKRFYKGKMKRENEACLVTLKWARNQLEMQQARVRGERDALATPSNVPPGREPDAPRDAAHFRALD